MLHTLMYFLCTLAAAACYPGIVGKVARMIWRWLGLSVLNLAVFVLAPIVMAPVAFLIAKPTTRTSGVPCLPKWLSWLNTPDDPTGEQGSWYEPAVKEFETAHGWRAKTWYWLGWRNQCYGLFWWIASKSSKDTKFTTSSDPFPKVTNKYTPGKWWATTEIDGRFYIEFTAVWEYDATRCKEFRIGWKLETLTHGEPGPVAYLFQPKLFPLKKG